MQKLIQFLRSIKQRKPAEAFYLVSLGGGANMIWTPGGNVVLSQSASRLLAQSLTKETA